MITKLNQLELNQITGGNNALPGVIGVGAAALFMTARRIRDTDNFDKKSVVGKLLSFTITSFCTFVALGFGTVIANTVSAAIHTAIDSLSPQQNNATNNDE